MHDFGPHQTPLSSSRKDVGVSFARGGRSREGALFLRDAALCDVDPADGRHIEVVVSGLPYARGIPVAVDATIVSPLHADGTPWYRAAVVPGISFERARKDKERTYP